MPFQKGHIINKGRKHSKRTKEKMSCSKKGRTFSKEHIENLRKSHVGYQHSESVKKKIALAHVGKKHPHSKESKEKIRKAYDGWNDGKKSHLWRGGRTEESKLIRQGREYREWRRKVFERDNYTCQECGKIGGKLNADHIKPFSIFPKLRFVVSNGRTLCETPCHKKTKTYGFKLKINEKTYEPRK